MDAWKIVEKMTTDDLLLVWECLQDYDPSETANGLPMDQWAGLIYSELHNRYLPIDTPVIE